MSFAKRILTLTLVIMGLTMVLPTVAETILMVVPSRPTAVRFAFDIEAIRKVTLVSYGGETEKGEQLLHTWDAEAKKWVYITLDEFSFCQFLSNVPDTLIIIGSDKDMPEMIVNSAPEAGETIRILSINPMPMANRLNEKMLFSPKEWRVLAKRHGLTIEDLNEEKRRYGRYGPPGKRIERPVVIDVDSELEANPEEPALKENILEEPVIEKSDTAEPVIGASNVVEPVIEEKDVIGTQVIEVIPLEPEMQPEMQPEAIEEKGMPLVSGAEAVEEMEKVEEMVEITESVPLQESPEIPIDTTLSAPEAVESRSEIIATLTSIEPEKETEETASVKNASEPDIIDTLQTESDTIVLNKEVEPPLRVESVKILNDPNLPIILPSEPSSSANKKTDSLVGNQPVDVWDLPENK